MKTMVSRYQWTQTQFSRAIEQCIFQENERVELLNGELFVTPLPSPAHETTVEALWEILSRQLPSGFYARKEGGLILNNYSLIAPDIAVVEGYHKNYRAMHPTHINAKLIIEVAYSSIAYDQGNKLEQYALSNIADYWVVDLKQQKVYTYRSPEGGGYILTQEFSNDDMVSPLYFPEIGIPVFELFS